MDGTGCRLLVVVVCAALCSAATGDVLSYSAPQNDLIDPPQTEVSPVQLEISLPIAAEQLLQLADSASPDVWRHILRQTPDAARRTLLAQLRARRRHSASRDNSLQWADRSRDHSQRRVDGSHDHHQQQADRTSDHHQQRTDGSRSHHHQRADRSRDRHQQRADRSRDRHQQRAGADLASRLSSYSGLGAGVDSVTKRAYSTLERDFRGRRRVSSGRLPTSAPRHPQTQTSSPPLRDTSYASRQVENLQPPAREYERPSSSYRPPPSDDRRQTSSQRPLSDVLSAPSFKASFTNYRASESDPKSDLSSSYSSWDASLPTSGLRPPPFEGSPAVTTYRSREPEVTTYRPRGAEVTTYRPRGAEVTSQRRGRAEVTTFRPARSDVSAPSVQYGPPRRSDDSGHTTQDRHQDGTSGYSSEQEQEHHQEHEELGWLRDVVPGVPGEDYPILDGIPVTSFSCAGRPHGYYSDVSARCQVYHVCHGAFQMSSFICPNGTVFSQPLSTCDWWFNTDCSDHLPLPSSTFRVSRQASRFMFEDDWVDDYEDFDVTDTNQLTEAHSGHRAAYQGSKAVRREQQAPSAALRRPAGDRSAPGGSDRSAPGGGDRSASSGNSHNPARRSSYAAVPGANEVHRSPERHLQVPTKPPGVPSGNYPGDNGKQRQTRRIKTLVVTPKTPASGGEGQKNTVSRPFVVQVSYGGKSGRTTKQLKFGPEAARNFLSRAQIRRWSFTGGSSIDKRIGVTETADNPEEQLGNTSRGTRTLEKARDKSFDFEIGRRSGPTLVGSESRVQARRVLPQYVTHHQLASPLVSRQALYRPPPTRRMSRPADLSEVAPPETSVEPPTVAEQADSTGNRAEWRDAASVRDRHVQRNRVISEISTIPTLTQEESQREESPSEGRTGGHGGKLSFAELTTDDPGSSKGGNELVADDSVDFDYEVLLSSESFKNFGLRMPSAPSPNEKRQSPG